MKDIFHPGERGQQVIKLGNNSTKVNSPLGDKKVEEGRMPLLGAKPGSEIKSSFIVTNNKRTLSSKTIIRLLIIILVSLLIYAGYYLVVNLKPKASSTDSNSNLTQDQDLKDFEKNINEIDNSASSLDSDTQDIDYPVIDFNVNL